MEGAGLELELVGLQNLPVLGDSTDIENPPPPPPPNKKRWILEVDVQGGLGTGIPIEDLQSQNSMPTSFQSTSKKWSKTSMSCSSPSARVPLLALHSSNIHEGEDSNVEQTPPSHSKKFTTRISIKASFKKDEEEEEEDIDGDDDAFKDGDLSDEFRRGGSAFMQVFQWLSLVVILVVFGCSLAIKKTFLEVAVWKWCLLVMALFCGRLVAGWLVKLIVYCVERSFLLRKRGLYFVYGLRRVVENCVWLGLVLIPWHGLFIHKVELKIPHNRSLSYINRILICLLVGNAIWVVKILLVKVMACNFHVRAYFDRIQNYIVNQYLLAALSGTPLMEIEQQHQKDKDLSQNEVLSQPKAIGTLPLSPGGREGRSSNSIQKSLGTNRFSIFKKLKSTKSQKVEEENEGGITIEDLQNLNQKNISAWNMKKLIHIFKNHGELSLFDESYHEAPNEDEYLEWKAKKASTKIFHNIAKPGENYISLEDLMRFLPEDLAKRVMAYFEGATDVNKVTYKAFRNWVMNCVFRERKMLSLTMNDTDSAVNKLNTMVDVVVGVLITVIWLLILEITTTQLILFGISQIMLFTFLFQSTCKSVFESIVFLFVMHPYDVGDRCTIDGEELIVSEMNILTTVFIKTNKEKVSYPNSLLATKPIGNFFRSFDALDKRYEDDGRLLVSTNTGLGEGDLQQDEDVIMDRTHNDLSK